MESITPKQLVAVRQLSNALRINQDAECHERYGCRADQMTSAQASELISDLQARAGGSIRRTLWHVDYARIYVRPLCLLFESGRFNQEVVDAIRNLPRKHRTFDGVKKVWVVHLKHKKFLCDLACRYFERAELVEPERVTDLKTATAGAPRGVSA